ncbi:MAG: energy transducer TonB [Lysobacterales bacterium]
MNDTIAMNGTIRMAPPLLATLTRFAVAGVTSLVVTFALLWLMQILIATGKDVLTDRRDFRFVDFVRIKQDEVVNLDEDKPEKPPEPEQQPPDMPQPQGDKLDTSNTVNISFTATHINLDPTRGNFAVVDGDYLPIVKVAAIYPRRADSRGVEGYCVVEFTVTKSGTVRAARAIECTSSLFERASVNAAAKFKYKPRVVDGQEIEVPGVQHIIRFEMEDD